MLKGKTGGLATLVATGVLLAATLGPAGQSAAVSDRPGFRLLDRLVVLVVKAASTGGGAAEIDKEIAHLIDEAYEKARTILTERRAQLDLMADVLIERETVDKEELQALPLRKPPKVDGTLRIVEIENFDWSACGGTHVARTGEVGLIKIVKLEKRSGETRVEFRCGRRALIDYRRKHQLVNQAAADLSIGFWELDQAIEQIGFGRFQRKLMWICYVDTRNMEAD